MDELSLLRRQMRRLAADLDYEAHLARQASDSLPKHQLHHIEALQEARAKRACARQIRIILGEEEVAA